VAGKKKEKWYAAGLSFECTQCGNCCTGEPGYVWVNSEEIRRISEFLGRKDGKLPQKDVRKVGFRNSLTERANGDCCYLTKVDGKRICSIYPVRPLQCRTWPFWTYNLKSPDHWNEAGQTCPGINRGKKRDFVAIEDIRLQKDW
jgi:Fe-S-cluster containining protein